ncbi:MAG: DUF3185 family protein [Acetobacteraceae bacterium]
MRTGQIVGAVLLAAGAVLLFMAYDTSSAPIERVSSGLTGRYTEQAMWYLAFGASSAIGGGLLFALGTRR